MRHAHHHHPSTVAIKLNCSYLAEFRVNTGLLPNRLGYDLLGFLYELDPDQLRENCLRMNFQAIGGQYKLGDVLDVFKAIVKYPGAIPFTSSANRVPLLNSEREPRPYHRLYHYIVDLDHDRFDSVFSASGSLDTEMVERLRSKKFHIEHSPIPATRFGEPVDNYYRFYGRFSSVNLHLRLPKTVYLEEYRAFIEAFEDDGRFDRFLQPCRLIDERLDAFTNVTMQLALEESLAA